jgi:hypothetical protein
MIGSCPWGASSAWTQERSRTARSHGRGDRQERPHRGRTNKKLPLVLIKPPHHAQPRRQSTHSDGITVRQRPQQTSATKSANSGPRGLAVTIRRGPRIAGSQATPATWLSTILHQLSPEQYAPERHSLAQLMPERRADKTAGPRSMFPIFLWRSVALLALQKARLAPPLLAVLCLAIGLSQADGSEAKGHQRVIPPNNGVSYASTPEDQIRAYAAKMTDQTHAVPNAACECLVENFPEDKEPISEAYFRGGGGPIPNEMMNSLDYWMNKGNEIQKCRFLAAPDKPQCMRHASSTQDGMLLLAETMMRRSNTIRVTPSSSPICQDLSSTVVTHIWKVVLRSGDSRLHAGYPAFADVV